MEVEKRISKGGLFQLFDWNAKSRKKLFANKSELPESSKHGKENFDSAVMSRLQQMKVHENGPGPSGRRSDYSSASSVSNDEGHGTKAPGVVARLMGLDSLPTSDVSEPSLTPFFDSHSFRDFRPRHPTDYQSEHQNIEYDNLRNKLDGFSRNPVELRLQKVQNRVNRPIERFQTEILPPKSAKSISITHHRLLSPIKSPGFIMTKNAAYIMEAAAKIIDQSPHSAVKYKLPSSGSSSVPLRIRGLKEKMEAAQKASGLPETLKRPREHGSKYVKGQLSDRSQSGSEGSQLFTASAVAKPSSLVSNKNKGKSVSLAVQAKVNVQRKEGSPSSVNRSFMKQDNEVNLGHLDKKQRNTQKNVQKRNLTSRTSDVLRQNNQKQNCASNKERVILKPKVPYQQDRKALTPNGSVRAGKTVNKAVENPATGGRNLNSAAAEIGKELSSSKTKNVSGKKRPVNGNISDGRIADDVYLNKNERSVKCNVSSDGQTNWDAVDRKNGMDVVSFTFTSPIKKAVPGSQSSSRVMEKNLCLNLFEDQSDSRTSTLSSLGLNVIGSDALSVLLEQKLKELASRVESSASSSASTLQDPVASLNVEKTLSTEHDKRLQFSLQKDKPGSQHDTTGSSIDEVLLKPTQQFQLRTVNLYGQAPSLTAQPAKSPPIIEVGSSWSGLGQICSPAVLFRLHSGSIDRPNQLLTGLARQTQEVGKPDATTRVHLPEYHVGSEAPEKHISSSLNSGYGRQLDYHYQSPISSLESSFSDGSCNSLDSKASFTSIGSKQCLSADSHETLGGISAKKPHSVEGEPDLSDSATSTSLGSVEKKYTITNLPYTNYERSSLWELEYVREVLSSADLTSKDFIFSQSHEVISPNLYDQLEHQLTGPAKKMEENVKLWRKVLFDCVSECVEFRCERLLGGGCKSWVKWTTLFRRKEWLAEELYKEMSGWTSMGDLMVDELVDKDMSTQYGKWVDFEMEEFEVGVEIEEDILTSLVDEVAADLLFF
ncbi:hypothetical protein RJ639_029706 [Escallonia herrerae]|uniref:DUF4378 domain-containing protein n=1 Tax=Escallonia herrerae TaxID=1293975 RepID=A0AA88WYP0_9ASTE|nr:hypothetical protein RJ639_029706 [Escallonia herrerae]